nr:HNH endonuclease signature motif containing protein [Corynebacterium lactis]
MSIRLGLSRGKVLQLCEIGLMLRRMPRVAELARETEALGLSHLNIIANGTYAISDEQIHAVENHVIGLLTPTRPRQAMIGPRKLNTKIGDIVAEYDDRARGDGTIPQITTAESVTIAALPDGKYSQIIATLRNDRAHVVKQALDAAVTTLNNKRRAELAEQARESEASAPEKAPESAAESEGKDAPRATLADALIALIRQQTTADVVLNVYRSPDAGEAWLDGAGWLGALATAEWMREVTHLRLSGDGAAESYRPTDAQVARVRGRDGTCRFPGCEAPAHQCDLDHIKPYNHDAPEEGGPTDTENLHCLCRRHHNLKTHGLYNVTAYSDGTELWTSVDGTTAATSVPSGPMAGFGRQTFDQRLTRKTKARQKNYIDWLLSFSVSTIFVMDEEDEEDWDDEEDQADHDEPQN